MQGTASWGSALASFVQAQIKLTDTLILQKLGSRLRQDDIAGFQDIAMMGDG